MSKETTAAQATATTPAPAAAPKEAVKATRKSGTDLEVFPNIEAAKAEAAKRVKGHRRIFTAKKDGKSTIYLASHPAYVGQVEFEKSGGTVVEAGKAPKTPKAVGVEGIKAALETMPEAERLLILEQLKKLTAKK